MKSSRVVVVVVVVLVEMAVIEIWVHSHPVILIKIFQISKDQELCQQSRVTSPQLHQTSRAITIQ